jgi:hypothetical protein
VVAWRFELVGAVAFIGFGLWYVLSLIKNPLAWGIKLSWSLTIAGPAFLVGILFLISWISRKK